MPASLDHSGSAVDLITFRSLYAARLQKKLQERRFHSPLPALPQLQPQPTLQPPPQVPSPPQAAQRAASESGLVGCATVLASGPPTGRTRSSSAGTWRGDGQGVSPKELRQALFAVVAERRRAQAKALQSLPPAGLRCKASRGKSANFSAHAPVVGALEPGTSSVVRDCAGSAKCFSSPTSARHQGRSLVVQAQARPAAVQFGPSGAEPRRCIAKLKFSRVETNDKKSREIEARTPWNCAAQEDKITTKQCASPNSRPGLLLDKCWRESARKALSVPRVLRRAGGLVAQAGRHVVPRRAALVKCGSDTALHVRSQGLGPATQGAGATLVREFVDADAVLPVTGHQTTPEQSSYKAMMEERMQKVVAESAAFQEELSLLKTRLLRLENEKLASSWSASSPGLQNSASSYECSTGCNIKSYTLTPQGVTLDWPALADSMGNQCSEEERALLSENEELRKQLASASEAGQVLEEQQRVAVQNLLLLEQQQALFQAQRPCGDLHPDPKLHPPEGTLEQQPTEELQPLPELRLPEGTPERPHSSDALVATVAGTDSADLVGLQCIAMSASDVRTQLEGMDAALQASMDHLTALGTWEVDEA